MRTHGDSRHSIAGWLEAEAPDRAPARLVDASRARVMTTPQRRAWWPAERSTLMRSVLGLGVAAAAVVVVGVVGLALPRGPLVGPAALQPSVSVSASPTASSSPVPPTAGPRMEAEQVITEGFLQAFAETADGTLLTIWDACKSERDTDCGIAWRLGSGPQPQATGVLSRVDFHPDLIVAGDGFILPGRSSTGTRIDRDGTSSPLPLACRDVSWSTPTEPGRLAWTSGLSFIDTMAGSICSLERLGGRPLAQGVFTSEGTLWALVDNETDPDGALSIGRYDGAAWRYHDFAAPSGSWTSVLAATGSTVVVLLANPEPSPRPDQLVGLAVSTDAGATWSEVVDPGALERDLPFSTVVSPNDDDWYSGYTSMAFAGPSTLYVADWNGDVWRSTDFATFSRVAISGAVKDLQAAGDAVIARMDAGGTCSELAGCRLDDLVRISADGSVEPITIR